MKVIYEIKNKENGKRYIGSGVNNGQAKCDENKILNIRFGCKNGKKLSYFADEYNMSAASISDIVNGKSYKKIGGPIKGEDY